MLGGAGKLAIARAMASDPMVGGNGPAGSWLPGVGRCRLSGVCRDSPLAGVCRDSPLAGVCRDLPLAGVGRDRLAGVGRD